MIAGGRPGRMTKLRVVTLGGGLKDRVVALGGGLKVRAVALRI